MPGAKFPKASKKQRSRETDGGREHKSNNRMASHLEEDYHDLLQPVKDAEKSFQIDVAQLLYSYINNFVRGKVPANFNSAALLLQGSSSIYGRKVEYLFNLATQLYQSLIKNKKDEQTKKDKPKEKHKESRFDDPFFSTEIKMGKNLSCLRKRNQTKNTTTKKSKKLAKKSLFVPIDLLPFEGEDKGDLLYDTKGEVVGYKNDFLLNRCRMTSLGWLLLPTVSLDLIPKENSPPDYTFHCNTDAQVDMPCSTSDECVDMPCSTPDEGVDMGSQSMSEASTPQLPLSQQTDEGLGSMQSTPQDMLSQPCSEASQPMEGVECAGNDGEIPNYENNLDVSASSVRRSMRLVLNSLDDDAKVENTRQEKASKEEKNPPAKLALIQKKNCCSLPKSKEREHKIENLALFCARTYFQMDIAFLKNGINNLETLAFRVNPVLMKKLSERMENFNNATKKSKNIEEEDENEEIDIETLNEPDMYDVDIPDHLEDDIVIENGVNDNPLPENELPQTDTNYSEDPIEDNELMKDMKTLDKNAEINARVNEFERKLHPFLNEVEKREAFDINLYGSRILNCFESCNNKVRKQTKTFKDFCKGMEQWQVHRFFMALLPLANIGNVSLETEVGPDGEEQIMITLLSKRMHHLSLEKFGNENKDYPHK